MRKRWVGEKVEFVFNTSPVLAILLSALYGGTVIVWLSLDFSCYQAAPSVLIIVVKWVGGVCIGCLGWQTVQLQANRQSPHSMVALWQDSRGQWGCRLRFGQLYRLSLLNDSYVGSYFLILRFSSRTKTINVLILRDMLAASEYRILCNRLRFY